MSTLLLAGLGELLWDVFKDEEKLGGAPANFAYHASNLGANSIVISTIGDDIRGNKALAELKKANLTTNGIAIDRVHPTGYVEAHINAKGIAEYFFPDNVAWDHLVINKATKDTASYIHAIAFGTLAQRTQESETTIHDFLHRLPKKCLKVFDINLRQHFYTFNTVKKSLEVANIVKLNEEELPVLTQMFKIPGDTRKQLQFLLDTFGLQLIILTQGGSGSILLSKNGIDIHPGFTTTVVDTVGAGDSFTAATVIGFIRGLSLKEINEHANHVAAHVCKTQGAMVAVPESLRFSE